MNALRKLMYRPKKTDTSFLAQFYYADEQLNSVAAELDSFDGRKDPERCTSLVNQLRHSQDEVLSVIDKIMCAVVPENSRACRDYRVKFPDDVLHESLAGQLWFGAECLSAGSSIMNREVESASMRPLAKTLTRHLDSLRSLLREQCFHNQYKFTDKIRESLIELDRLFAEFELSYVSAMVPVKTMKEYELLQDLTVLFCETVDRALWLGLLTQDMIDMYDPALMFTIPRLAIVSGLIIHPEGPLNPDKDSMSISEMFRPFQTLLFKIRELLWTFSDAELNLLEKSLCSTDDTDRSSAMLAELSGLPPELLLSWDVQPLSGFYADDLSDTDDGAASRGLMVHSESTMTVVERPGADEAAVTSSAVLTDAEARRLHHSKSWPQRDDGQRTAATTSFDGVTSSAVAVYGNQQFNFNLPHNTSTEHLYADTHAATAGQRFADQSIIYLSSPTSSVSDEQQFAYITDELCRIFCTDTASLDDDDDDVEVAAEKLCDVGTVDLLVDSEAEASASVQRQCLEVIACDCNRAVDSLLTPTNETSSLIGDITTVPSAAGDVIATECVSQDAGGTDALSVNSCALLADTLSAGDDVDLAISLSTTELPSVEPHATSADDLVDPSSSDVITSANDVEYVDDVAAEDVAIATLEECHSDAAESTGVSARSCLVDDSDMPTPSSSTPQHLDPSSSGPCVDADAVMIDSSGRAATAADQHLDPSSSGPCVDADAVMIDSSGRAAMAAGASNSLELSHEHESYGSETSSYSSECRDDEEIALAIHAAEVTARHEARSRFKNAADLIHRLFVCISGVADQLQTNYASDLRHMLKSVFDSCTSDVVARLDAAEDSSSAGAFNHTPTSTDSFNSHLTSRTITSDEMTPNNNNHHTATSALGAPVWVPDDQSLVCMSCHATFTFVKRRHHCRNCGKIFCGHCSSNTVPLPHIGHDKPVRVCNHCFVFHVTPFTMNTSSSATATEATQHVII